MGERPLDMGRNRNRNDDSKRIRAMINDHGGHGAPMALLDNHLTLLCGVCLLKMNLAYA